MIVYSTSARHSWRTSGLYKVWHSKDCDQRNLKAGVKTVAMEERVTGAWSDDVPAQQVKREALIRQQQGGWDSVRRSIDTTIR